MINAALISTALLPVMNIKEFKHTKVCGIIILFSTLGVIMEQVKFDYSMKNIPIPPKQEFMIQMINSAEKFVKNIRWRAFHFLNPQQNNSRKETFNFNSTKPAPAIKELKHFENSFYDLINNIKFSQYNNSFQTKLNDDRKKINAEKDMIIPADKTNNFYKVSKEDYNGLLQKHITKDYRKTDEKAFDDNTEKDKEIAVDLELDDRIYKTAKKQAFITLKDHKPRFRNNPTCRLLNPTKPEIGKISKQILRKIVKIVRENSQLKQWENTDKVIEWFTNIQNKQSLTFI